MRKLCLLALAVTLIPVAAQAFGRRGHQIIANLGYERLTPQAKADVDALLAIAPQQGTPQCPVSGLNDAATWLDCTRRTNVPGFSSMAHNELIPLCQDRSAPPPCADGNCDSVEIQKALDTLKNSSGVSVKRLQALEVVIHLVGDSHQPLHTVEAWGNTGSKIRVNFPGDRRRTLHHIWDVNLVEIAASDANGGVDAIRSLANRNASQWAKGTPEDWVQDSHAVGVRVGYGGLGLNGCGPLPRLPLLDDSYIQNGAKAEQTQLAKGAVRLAYALNAVLH